jgi:hypothetical protein
MGKKKLSGFWAELNHQLEEFADKKDDPQIKSPTLSTVKPKEPLQPVEQKPKIAEPGTPRAMGDDPWVGGAGRK